jgi:hypothetical protein
MGATVKFRHIAAPWHSFTDARAFLKQKGPYSSASPSDVKGLTNVAMAWMPESGHGSDGRLAILVVKRHGSPF